MIDIDFSKREREIIHIWYENMRERSGHFGDGAATFPDEDIILRKIAEAGPYKITKHHLEMILDWSEHCFSAPTPEEYRLVEKILNGLGRSADELSINKPVSGG